MSEIDSQKPDQDKSFDAAGKIQEMADQTPDELADTLDMEVAALEPKLTRFRKLLNQYLSGIGMYRPRPGEIDGFLATRMSQDVLNALSEKDKLERAVSILESDIGNKKGRSAAIRTEYDLGEGVTEFSYDRTTSIEKLEDIEQKLLKLLDELSVARNEFYKGSADAAFAKIPDLAKRTHLERRDNMDDIEYLEFMLGVMRLKLPELREFIKMRKQEEAQQVN